MTKENKEDKDSVQDIDATVMQIETDPLSQFHLSEDDLRLELVKAQYALRETRRLGQPTGLLVIINGMELSGKGAAVTQLRQWVDPRLLNVEATIGNLPSQSEPIWQAHVQKLPRHGNVTVYFGNWYADLICGAIELNNLYQDRHTSEEGQRREELSKDIDWQAYLQEKLATLTAFEADLSANHTKLLKCWFHIDEDTLRARLEDEKEDPQWLYHMDWKDKSAVASFNQVAKELLSQQEDWVIIDGSNSHCYNSETDNNSTKRKTKHHSEKASKLFCHEVLQAIQQALVCSQSESRDSESPKAKAAYAQTSTHAAFSWVDIPDKLTDIDDPDMDKSDYREKLEKKQEKLAHLLRERNQLGDNSEGYKAGESQRHVIFAFEGMDAAGKGGAIKRLVMPLDPREYQIYNIAAPTQTESQYPYLWRFWTRLPEAEPCHKEERLSRIAIFDRTWYGRVLVERIEGFASEAAWQRAYDEINRMEYDLAQKGTVILKYWLAIDKEEQLERFEERQETPHKKFKLTDDDWRNRDKWYDYVQAAADMLARTNTKYAPWHVVATNDKRTARLAVLDHAIAQLEI